MFEKDALDALFAELETSHGESNDYGQLLRDAHLGIALSDAGKGLGTELDPRVVALIEKHRDDGQVQ